jgi:hypothetical protein
MKTTTVEKKANRLKLCGPEQSYRALLRDPAILFKAQDFNIGASG